MAAGQQKRRPVSSSLQEHYRGKKKKKVDSYDNVLNLRPQIYLEWDDSKKKAVPKREQIGLKWMDMAPFVDSVPLGRSGLADVLPVPQEIYSSDNLTDVLCYEVWATCLSESERKLLTQFLPSGTGAEQAVNSLLTGENHHFGNPFIKWSTSLCTGNLHPDDILQKERQIRSNKKQYYPELDKYHTSMIGVLKTWKLKWSRCNDPEIFWRKYLVKDKEGKLLTSTDQAKVSLMPKKPMPQKAYIRNCDIAKYLSCIKVTKKQHEAIKSLKNSGDGIQSKSLNHVLGDISEFHVHPYKVLEEEEKVRLHEHWLQVVKKDIPLAFEVHKDKKLQRANLRKRFVQELYEKGSLKIDKINQDKPERSPQKNIEDAESEHCPVRTIVEENVVSAFINSDNGHHLEHVTSLNSHQELSPTTLDPAIGDSSVIKQFNSEENLSKGVESRTLAAKNMWQSVDAHKHFKKEYQDPTDQVSPTMLSNIPVKNMWQAVDGHEQFKEKCQDPIDQVTPNMLNNISVISQFKEEDILEDGEESKGLSSPIKDVCKVVDSHLYSSSSDFNFGMPQPIEEHHAPIIDLERDVGAGESDDALFSLLPSFSKGANMFPSYTPHEHLTQLKQPELPFLMVNGNLPGTIQYPHKFQQQQSLIEQRLTREKDHLFMHQMENKSLYSNGRYPNQEITWFSNEHCHQNNNCWSGVEQSTSGPPCLGENGNSDLFSVLSECRNLSSWSSYNCISSEQPMEARNFGSGNDGPHSFAPQQFKSTNSHEAAPANSAALWMNSQPQQNSSLQDSIGKPFLRSWNQ